MGYTTDFSGEFGLDKPLTVAQLNYLTRFSESRRMCRDVTVLNRLLAEQTETPTHVLAGLTTVGVDGEYYVDATGFAGQDCDESTKNHGNKPPSTQPGLWCQWVPNGTGTAIEWDGGEKFYDYVEWIKYIINNFLKPWGYTVNGKVQWSGEEQGDVGLIVVTDNNVAVKEGRIVFD